ncbi:hypothetical protein BD410DRAFT_845218 [Rickenella mellea]|uniref:Uncharacterized protein n=1 Tax=Rickenella mellea TaxID=50990 RepID=A0A4Y7PKS0_9AGAM|nr:hypothetical protein BD410DRAFT_845218 [Rickenella mellea]
MFMLNRYTPFTDTFLAFYLQFASPSTRACVIGSTVYGWITLFGVLLSEIILMMRVYALWALRRSILIVLVIIAMVLYVPAISIVEIIAKSYQDIGAPTGCWKPTLGAKTIFLLFVILLISETLGHTHSRLLIRIYRDGLIYYLYLFAISLTNLIIPLAAPGCTSKV